MEEDSTVAAGPTFLVTDGDGRVTRDHHGLYHRDTRLLDRHEVALGHRARETLATIGPRPGEQVLRAEMAGEPPVVVRRTRALVGQDATGAAPGVYERVEVRNDGDDTLDTTLRVAVGTRFDDVFEVRGVVDRERTRSIGVEPGDGVAFSYDPDGGAVHYRTGAALDVDAQVDVHGGMGRADAVLGADLRVAPGGVRTVHLATASGGPPADPAAAFAAARDHVRGRARRWWTSLTPLSVEDRRGDVVHRAVEDLLALATDTGQGRLFAAGLPWFGAPVGRDAVLSAYATLPLSAAPARGTLRYLAAHQATETDPRRSAEPGKMLHEHRHGELAARGEVPHTPYYGAVDATPLWVVLLHETWRATGDDALVADLHDSLEAALSWLGSHDGFLTYDGQGGAGRPPGGLDHQGWKDSEDGVVHPDGSPVEGPIALASVQGYAHDALRRAAALYRGPLGEPSRGRSLDRQADVLADAFDAAFWLPGASFYAVALDGDGDPVRTVTSSPGHCLWSGVVPPERADAVVDRLLADDVFSGWGLRTVAAGHDAYDPESYHRGAVWPHDTALAALGMARYGRGGAAERLVDGICAAALDRGARLPELFAGYGRDERDGVVDHPDACEPQACAAAAPLTCLRVTEGAGPSLDSP
jgi:glycogen debranching enzyme